MKRKVVLLSAASSIHTVRWANALCQLNFEVHVVSQHKPSTEFSSLVNIHSFKFRGVFGYFLIVPAVLNLMRKLNPDIVHAHYASGYGTTARLVNYRPFLLSVWGSDVYEFPSKSFFHKHLIKSNLLAADAVASTSHCMAEQVRKLVPEIGDIAITPFGVSSEEFSKSIRTSSMTQRKVVVGTVKSMKHIYGIDTLLHAFEILARPNLYEFREKDVDVELRVVGDGEQLEEFKALAQSLNIADKVRFIGSVAHKDVSKELAKMDIFVALSRFESFGVSVLEAGACGLPVVVSDAEGLAEVVVDGRSGFVVPKDTPCYAANAIKKLVHDPALRIKIGSFAKKHVAENYSWHKSVTHMIEVYDNILTKSSEQL